MGVGVGGWGLEGGGSPRTTLVQLLGFVISFPYPVYNIVSGPLR